MRRWSGMAVFFGLMIILHIKGFLKNFLHQLALWNNQALDPVLSSGDKKRPFINQV